VTDAQRWAYGVLGVSEESTEAEIKEAYRDLVAVWHPDRHGGNDRLRIKAEQKLRDINAARDIIQELLASQWNPERFEYDGASKYSAEKPGDIPHTEVTFEESAARVTRAPYRKRFLLVAVPLGVLAILACLTIMIWLPQKDAAGGAMRTTVQATHKHVQMEDLTKLTPEERAELEAERRFRDPKDSPDDSSSGQPE
jgi:hypothetical protein